MNVIDLNNESFKKEKVLIEAVKSIQDEYDVFLTVHDLKGRLHYSDGKAILPGFNVHMYDGCLKTRNDSKTAEQKCYSECFYETEYEAGKRQVPFLKTCWTGVTELVVPIFLKEQHVISILAGAFRLSSRAPGDMPDWHQQFYEQLPLVDIEKLSKLANILLLLGNGLVSWKVNHENEEKASGRKYLILKFIEEHAHENIVLKDLAKHLNLSPSRTRHLIRELTNRTFTSLLENERMVRAKYLINNTNQSIYNIAENVGYKNEYYFNRVFKKYYAVPPGSFRKLSTKQIKK